MERDERILLGREESRHLRHDWFLMIIFNSLLLAILGAVPVNNKCVVTL